MNMDKPPKILTKEGVLTRTPGMINRERHEVAVEEAIKKESAGEKSTKEAGLIKRQKSKAEDDVEVEKLKEKLGKAFSKEGLVDRNFGKKRE